MRFSASRSLSATVPATETLASSAAFWASSVARSVASVPEAQALKTLRLMSLALSITFDDGSLWAFGSAMPRFSSPYGGGFDDRDPPEDSSSGCGNETLTGCRPRGTGTRPHCRVEAPQATPLDITSAAQRLSSPRTPAASTLAGENAVSVVMTAATVATPGIAHAAGRVCSRLGSTRSRACRSADPSEGLLPTCVESVGDVGHHGGDWYSVAAPGEDTLE